jgi:hypothetical protein
MNFAEKVTVCLCLYGIVVLFACAFCRVAADADRRMGLKD